MSGYSQTDAQPKDRIKTQLRRMRGGIRMVNFRISTLSAFTLLVFVAAAIGLQTVLGLPFGPEAVATLVGGALVTAAVVALFPLWGVLLGLIALVWGSALYVQPEGIVPALALLTVGLLLYPSIQIIRHWDRVVVFRLGRFHKVLGPGPHVLVPVLDSIVQHVDMRIRVTDFSAERSVTSDTVPVHVDALAFWMVWDAGKAILEVENYYDAVTLSAQTALRDTIGRNELAKLLSERERLGAEIQETLDAKTSPWGVTILSIEFTEILLPKELEDALSRKAQAERERQARVILSSAEVDIAEKFEEAGRRYEANPQAFELRAMNLVYDGMKQNQNMILVPTSAVESMGTGGGLAMAALRRSRRGFEEDAGRAQAWDTPNTAGAASTGASGDPTGAASPGAAGDPGEAEPHGLSASGSAGGSGARRPGGHPGKPTAPHPGKPEAPGSTSTSTHSSDTGDK